MAKDNNTLVKGITAVLLAGVMAGGGVTIGYGAATDWTFKKADTNITQEENKDNENGGSVVADGESSGMTIMSSAIALSSYEEYGVSALAENAYSLNVTYTPADTTYQETTYSIAFADGTDCSAYATVSQSAEGSKDAVLTILKAFNKQIIVTATCNRNTEIKATTTVDYVGTNYVIILNNTVDDVSCDIEFVYKGFRDGTLSASTDNCFTFVFDFTDFGYERISQRMSESGYTFASSVSYTCTPEGLNETFSVAGLNQLLYKAGGMESASTTEKAAYWQALSSAMLNGNKPEDLTDESICNCQVISHRNYNNVDYADVEVYDIEIAIYDWSGFEVSATSISSNTSSIIAG